MESSKKCLGIQKEIVELRSKLNNIVDPEVMSSEKILKLSRELDALILGYYKQSAEMVENY